MAERSRSLLLLPRFRDDTEEAADGPTRIVVALLVLLPMAFNAVALAPEVLLGAPSRSDNAFQSMLVRVASDALATGRNPLDFWQPQLELGFPQFLYYQNLPHLFVVGLHRLALGFVDPFTLYNVARYALLVTLPLTVFWSMRRMGFSLAAAGVSAAAASLLSGDFRFGFEYDSYIWRGLGMFTQLWAMHFSFIALACVYRVLKTGTGYLPAVIALALLALSHLIYAYMMVITLGLVLLIVGDLRTILPRIARLATVGLAALAVSSYMWLPFITSQQYIGVSPYLQSWKYDSFGAQTILGWLVSGDLLDHGRIPVLSLLLGIGIVAAVLRLTRLTILAVAGFFLWLVLYFGRPTLGPLADLLPLHDGMLFHRFIGEMEVFAILLIGIGGEAIWRLVMRVFAAVPPKPWARFAWAAPLAAFLLIVALLLPAVEERTRFYSFNTAWLERVHNGVAADTDLHAILSTIKAQPYGGRSYAGLRTNYGTDMTVGVDLKVTDLLTFNDIPAVSPPYQSLSLNADLIWWFQDGDPSDFDVLDVRYAIVPTGFQVPDFYEELYRKAKYTLYRIATSGVAEYVEIASRRAVGSQRSLFDANLAWFQGPDPAAGRFIRWDYLQPLGPLDLRQPCPSGRTLYERVEFDAMHLVVECPTDGALALKATYHPNWRVTVDGRDVSTYMVSPSFVGIDLPAGRHVVEAWYEATPSKVPLLMMGLIALGAVAVLRRRLDALPRRLGTIRRPRSRAVRFRGRRSSLGGTTQRTGPGSTSILPTLTALGHVQPQQGAPNGDPAGRRQRIHSRHPSLNDWALPALLIVGLLLPVVVGIASGTLDLPRNDDWSYRRLALHLFDTGQVELDQFARPFLVGQLLLVQPFLWMAGGQTAGFIFAGLAFQAVAIISGYAVFRRFLAPPKSALAIGLLIVFPGFLPYAVSFMTDVPAIACEMMCLWIGMIALTARERRGLWLFASVAVGLLGFTIREIALAAPAAVVVANVITEPRRWSSWLAIGVLVAGSVGLYVWRSSLPGQLPDIPNTTAWAYRLPLAFTTVALVLLPASIVGWALWRHHMRRIDAVVGLAAGLLLASGRLLEAVGTGRLPQILLDVNMTQFGAPAPDYLTGARPILFPDPIWAALSVLALVATVVVPAIATGIAGFYLRRALKAPRSIAAALATPPGLVALFAGGTAVGLVWFGLNQWIYDRYFWVLIPPLAALLMYRPRGLEKPADGVMHVQRRRERYPVVIAAALVAVLGLTSLAYLLNSAAFDEARWRAGRALTDLGVPADAIDAGYEWVGYHATTVANYLRPVERINWWQELWPGFRMCGLVASVPQGFASARLVAEDTYKLFLFAGPDVSLYLYTVATVACPGQAEA